MSKRDSNALYNRLMNKEGKRAEKLAEAKLKKKQEELQECTHAPKINKKFNKRMKQREQITKRVNDILEQRQKKLIQTKKIEKMKEEDELDQNCTFKPKINKKSINLTKNKWINKNRRELTESQERRAQTLMRLKQLIQEENKRCGVLLESLDYTNCNFEDEKQSLSKLNRAEQDLQASLGLNTLSASRDSRGSESSKWHRRSAKNSLSRSRLLKNLAASGEFPVKMLNLLERNRSLSRLDEQLEKKDILGYRKSSVPSTREDYRFLECSASNFRNASVEKALRLENLSTSQFQSKRDQVRSKFSSKLRRSEDCLQGLNPDSKNFSRHKAGKSATSFIGHQRRQSGSNLNLNKTTLAPAAKKTRGKNSSVSRPRKSVSRPKKESEKKESKVNRRKKAKKSIKTGTKKNNEKSIFKRKVVVLNENDEFESLEVYLEKQKKIQERLQEEKKMKEIDQQQRIVEQLGLQAHDINPPHIVFETPGKNAGTNQPSYESSKEHNKNLLIEKFQNIVKGIEHKQEHKQEPPKKGSKMRASTENLKNSKNSKKSTPAAEALKEVSNASSVSRKLHKRRASNAVTNFSEFDELDKALDTCQGSTVDFREIVKQNLRGQLSQPNQLFSEVGQFSQQRKIKKSRKVLKKQSREKIENKENLIDHQNYNIKSFSKLARDNKKVVPKSETRPRRARKRTRSKSKRLPPQIKGKFQEDRLSKKSSLNHDLSDTAILIRNSGESGVKQKNQIQRKTKKMVKNVFKGHLKKTSQQSSEQDTSLPPSFPPCTGAEAPKPGDIFKRDFLVINGQKIYFNEETLSNFIDPQRTAKLLGQATYK